MTPRKDTKHVAAIGVDMTDVADTREELEEDVVEADVPAVVAVETLADNINIKTKAMRHTTLRHLRNLNMIMTITIVKNLQTLTLIFVIA